MHDGYKNTPQNIAVIAIFYGVTKRKVMKNGLNECNNGWKRK